MSLRQDGVMLSGRVETKTVQDLEVLAKRRGVSRSEVLRDALDRGIRQLQGIERRKQKR